MVLKARDSSKADLAKLSKLDVAVREHGKKDPNFRRDVNAFIKAKDDAEVQATAIGSRQGGNPDPIPAVGADGLEAVAALDDFVLHGPSWPS